eukprot:g995.t1
MRDREVRNHLHELKRMLCEKCRLGEQKGSSCPSCKATLQRARLQWHPDKNPAVESLATSVFRSVQAVWDGQPQWLESSTYAEDFGVT